MLILHSHHTHLFGDLSDRSASIARIETEPLAALLHRHDLRAREAGVLEGLCQEGRHTCRVFVRDEDTSRFSCQHSNAASWRGRG